MKLAFYITIILFYIISSINAQNTFNDTLSTSSGLKYMVLKKGSGEKALAKKEMEVHYHGTFADGKKFDSSYDRDEPIFFILGANQMIPGFDEGVSLMNVGDKYKLIIPYQLAYGEEGRGPIPPKATLIFDVELLSQKTAPTPIVDTLYNEFKSNGIDATIKLYENLRMIKESNFDFREQQLNSLGYRIMTETFVKEAIKIFELNVQQFPESGNVFDSLGEGYMMDKQIDKSIEYYKLSIEKNPDNPNAKEMIELLEYEKEKMNKN